MSIVKDQYDIKEKNTALFVACLKNSSVYEDHGKIILVDNESLNDLINKFISEKKFIEANELINTAKNIGNDNLITAEVTSKSFRLPIETYSKLLILSGENDESIVEVLKKIIIPKMCSTIGELHNIPKIQKKNLEILTAQIEDWNRKESIKRDYAFFPFIDIPHYKFNMDEIVRKYLQKILHTASLNIDVDPKIVDMFIDLHSIDHPNFIKDMDCKFEAINEKIMCTLYAGFDADMGWTTEITFNDSAKETFGEKPTSMVSEKIIKDICDAGSVNLGIYELLYENGNILINGVDPQDENLMQKMAYEKLADEYPRFHHHDNSFERYCDISLLPSDFDEDNYSQRLQEAIANNDYESSSEIGEFLETHQILTMLSIQVCEVFKHILKETKVVSITIPKTLLNLFDLTRGEKSAKNFIREDVDNYWVNHKIEE